jgi:hypothetical protein
MTKLICEQNLRVQIYKDWIIQDFGHFEGPELKLNSIY